jgi:2-keto-4-pentenoate hydratase
MNDEPNVVSPEELDEAANRHAPLSRTKPPPRTLDEAYCVQQAFVARRSERTGAPVRGYKIAFTSPAAQAAVNTDGYASGVLLESDIWHSGATVRLSERFTPIIEVELAFRVVGPIDAQSPPGEILERTEVAAAIEMPESRFGNWFGGEYPALSLAEVISDDCLAGLVIVGDRWTQASDVDLAGAQASLHRDGELVRAGSVDLVVPGPIAAVSWLAGQLAARGESLVEGQVVASGTWTDTISATPGSYTALFGSGIGAVSVEVV